MEYYNHEGKLVTYDILSRKKTLNGECSNVYVFDDYVVKQYYKYTHDRNRVHYETYEIVNNLNNNHLLKIQELLIEREKYDTLKSAEDNFKETIIDAYIAPFYKSDKSSILDKNTDFILEMLNELKDLAIKLASKKVALDDVKPENLIIQENNMIIIDWDKFNVVDDEVDLITSYNIYFILYLFEWLCVGACKNKHEKSIMRSLFDFIPKLKDVYKEDSEIILSERLNGCKTLRYYLYKK